MHGTSAVEKVKADRGGEGAGALEIPPELKHYEERYWFLGTQVAEIEKHKIHICQDYLDLAALIERGEIVPVPAVTDTYVLLGVGQRADQSEFSRYEEDKSQLDEPEKQPLRARNCLANTNRYKPSQRTSTGDPIISTIPRIAWR